MKHLKTAFNELTCPEPTKRNERNATNLVRLQLTKEPFHVDHSVSTTQDTTDSGFLHIKLTSETGLPDHCIFEAKSSTMLFNCFSLYLLFVFFVYLTTLMTIWPQKCSDLATLFRNE